MSALTELVAEMRGEVKVQLSAGSAETAEALSHYATKIESALAAEREDGRDALVLIATERARQVDGEGFSPRGDDEYAGGELAQAASCYATGSRAGWPWHADWWKPTPHDRIRELVKAGALIVAEIERLQRAAPTPEAIRGE